MGLGLFSALRLRAPPPASSPRPSSLAVSPGAGAPITHLLFPPPAMLCFQVCLAGADLFWGPASCLMSYVTPLPCFLYCLPHLLSV